MREDPSKEAQPAVSDRAMRLLIRIARKLPPWLGYRLAVWAGWLSAWIFPHRRAILESNLAPVLGNESARRLRRVAAQIFGHALLSYYELLRMPMLPLEKVLEMVESEEPGWTQLLEAYRRGKGVILVGPHQSSFDMAGCMMVAHGLRLCVFTLPDEVGYGSLNELRGDSGAQVLPAGPGAVRQALRALRRGEVLVMAGDRPTKGQGTVVEFFGRPTLLPDGHVRLALHTGAAVFVAFAFREGRKYHLSFAPQEIVRTGDTQADIRENVQRIARALEPPIRARPAQWHLFRRLWE